jgi:hypothetical protein
MNRNIFEEVVVNLPQSNFKLKEIIMAKLKLEYGLLE